MWLSNSTRAIRLFSEGGLLAMAVGKEDLEHKSSLIIANQEKS